MNKATMTPLQKKYVKYVRNPIEAAYLRTIGNPGLLTPFEDDRDHISKFGFGIQKKYDILYPNLDIFRYQFNQDHFNICTFAAAVKAVSEQLSINLSVRFYVCVGKRWGRISGNGFCDQRTVLEILTKIGIVTYEEMPDEIGDLSWSQYSAWNTKCEMLYLNNPENRRFTGYEKLISEAAIDEAHDNGFVVVLASKWYEAMNQPNKVWFYLLRFIGAYIGGHQYRSTGRRMRGEHKDYSVPQTFGKYYGKDGCAWVETLFGKQFYSNYIVHYNDSPLLPLEVILPIFLQQHEGLMVKIHEHFGDPRCYVIEGGKKRHVRSDDNMKTYFDLEGKVGLTRVNKTVLDAIPEGEPYPFI